MAWFCDRIGELALLSSDPQVKPKEADDFLIFVTIVRQQVNVRRTLEDDKAFRLMGSFVKSSSFHQCRMKIAVSGCNPNGATNDRNVVNRPEFRSRNANPKFQLNENSGCNKMP